MLDPEYSLGSDLHVHVQVPCLHFIDNKNILGECSQKIHAGYTLPVGQNAKKQGCCWSMGGPVGEA